MHLRMVLASGAILFALATIPSSDATAQAVISARTADQMGAQPAKQYREAKAVKVASANSRAAVARTCIRRKESALTPVTRSRLEDTWYKACVA